MFEVASWIPGVVRVGESQPLDAVLNIISQVLEVQDFFYFPLLFAVNYDRGWLGLEVAGYRSVWVLCWFEE